MPPDLEPCRLHAASESSGTLDPQAKQHVCGAGFLSPRRKSRPVACPFAPFSSHRTARGALPILLEGPMRQPLMGLSKPCVLGGAAKHSGQLNHPFTQPDACSLPCFQRIFPMRLSSLVREDLIRAWPSSRQRKWLASPITSAREILRGFPHGCIIGLVDGQLASLVRGFNVTRRSWCSFPLPALALPRPYDAAM